jgi:hypothetical protein
MNRGGVAEFNPIAYVAGRESDRAAGTAMLHQQPAVSMSSEGA